MFGDDIGFQRSGNYNTPIGSIENNRYNVSDTGLRDRSFTGFSGLAGINVGLWKGGSFVSNYTFSSRAPSLEELYNNGPHN